MTLRRRDFAVEEEQREKLLDVIAQESERLATIVNDILWASRLDAQSMQFSIQSCDAVALAQGVVDAADAHRPAGIELVLRAPDELPRVAGDPDKIRQVLANLLDNADQVLPRRRAGRRRAHARARPAYASPCTTRVLACRPPSSAGSSRSSTASTRT